jgi:hypothetical protein
MISSSLISRIEDLRTKRLDHWSRCRPRAQEVAMSELPAAPDHPEAGGPTAPRRVVPDWEYQTAYIPSFQVRMSAELHERLSAWARQAGKSSQGLMIEILEEAIRRRRDEAAPDSRRAE